VCHSWLNRSRKLLVCHEKLEHSFLALTHLAAAIIAFRKWPQSVNMIQRSVLVADQLNGRPRMTHGTPLEAYAQQLAHLAHHADSVHWIIVAV